MPRDPEANQRIKDERRQHILRAARIVFARKGLSAAKISDIATAANLSHGLVYHYFESKEAVYSALVREAVDHAISTVHEFARGDADPWQRLSRFVEHMLDRVRVEPEAYMLMVHALMSEANPEEARAEVTRFAAEAHPELRALFEEGQRSGQVVADIDARELMTTLFATLHGLALTELLQKTSPCPFEERKFPRASTLLRLLAAQGEK